jgi:hypothetical protein
MKKKNPINQNETTSNEAKIKKKMIWYKILRGKKKDNKSPIWIIFLGLK